MLIRIRLPLILQLSLIPVKKTYASQTVSLDSTETHNKAATDELLKIVKNKETTSDDIIALIDKNADVNAKDEGGITALMCTAFTGLASASLCCRPSLIDYSHAITKSNYPRAGQVILIFQACFPMIL